VGWGEPIACVLHSRCASCPAPAGHVLVSRMGQRMRNCDASPSTTAATGFAGWPLPRSFSRLDRIGVRFARLQRGPECVRRRRTLRLSLTDNSSGALAPGDAGSPLLCHCAGRLSGSTATLQRLLERRLTRLLCLVADSQAVKLSRHVAAAETEHHLSARDSVPIGRFARQHHRVSLGDATDERAESDRPREFGQRCECRGYVADNAEPGAVLAGGNSRMSPLQVCHGVRPLTPRPARA
jgi:hypothetical protein